MQVRLPTVESSPVVPVAATAAVAAASALCVLIAYVASPAIAIALPVVGAILAAILVQPMVGVYLAVLAAPLESHRIGGDSGFSPSELLFLAAAASTALHAVVSRRLRWPPDPAHLAFIGLLIVVAMGAVVAVDAFAVLKVVVMWSAFLVVSMLVASASRPQLRGLLLAIALCGAILGGMAIPNAGQLELVGGGSVAAGRAAAGFTSPNFLGFFLVLVLAPTVALTLRARGLARLPLAAATGLALAGLVLTLSRSAIIGAVVSVVVMLLLPSFRRAGAVVLALVAVAVAVDGRVIEGTREVSIVRDRLATFQQERHTNPRLQIYRAAPTIIGAHPILGIGEANFPTTSAEYGLRDIGGDVFQHAHSLPLTVAIETGLVGLCVFVAFLVAVARAMLRALRSRWRDDRALALGLAAALTGFFVASLADYPLRAHVIMGVAMLEIGAIVAYARYASAGPPATRSGAG